MFGIIMTTRGSPAPRSRPDRDRIYHFPGGEPTGPEDHAKLAAASGRGRQIAGEQSREPRIFRSESRGTGETHSARARRLLAADLTYIAHPSFDDSSARDAILASVPGHATPGLDRAPVSRNDHVEGSQRTRFPCREQEAQTFRQMNYLKCLACRIRDHIDPDSPALGNLDEIERLQTKALKLKNQIVETHLRLVVMVAKKHFRAGQDLEDRVSDGTLVLMRAVDRFDFARGCRFSTYATWAIFNALVQRERKERHRARSRATYEDSVAALHSVSDRYEPDEAIDERRPAVQRLLRRLDRRERRIIVNRYGIGGVPERTLVQIGVDLGISKERVRQLEMRAHAKLRSMALLEGITPTSL